LCVDDDPITYAVQKSNDKLCFSNEIITTLNGEGAPHYFDAIKELTNDDQAPQKYHS
jgi:hypothetical protein